ncbi:hypothetical protein AQUCO_04500023v1 [Aquilegia coerulea]|nr:hypothetical protein AQUCO_04500023v1 [Aquilegia coerulea]
MMTVLTDNIDNISTNSAASIVNAQDALTGLFGVLGAICVDAYLTNHGMIFFSSIFYLAGLMLVLGVFPYNIWLISTGISLITVGKSNLHNSSRDLSREFYQKRDLSGEGNRSKTILPSIKKDVRVPTILLVLLVLFLYVGNSTEFFGQRILKRLFTVLPAVCMLTVVVMSFNFPFVKPIAERVNPLKHVARVFIAAILKCRLTYPDNVNELNDENPAQQATYTNGYRFLEKAAIKEAKLNMWLCTRTEVEECKHLLRMAPVCTTFIAYGMVKSVGNTYFLEQGNQMDTKILSKEFPLQAFLILAELLSSVSTKIYKISISNKLSGPKEIYAPTISYAMGTVLSTLCCSMASWLATEVFQHNSKLSVFWLVPQFIVFGAMDGLAYDGIEGFFSDQLPPSVKRYGPVFTEAMVGVGACFATVLVLLINLATGWMKHKRIEDNRVDRFYHLLTLVGITIFFVYIYLAVRYHCKDNGYIQVEYQEQIQEENEEVAELLPHVALNIDHPTQEEENDRAYERILGHDSTQNIQPEDDLLKEQKQEQEQLIPSAASTIVLLQQKTLSRRSSKISSV